MKKLIESTSGKRRSLFIKTSKSFLVYAEAFF